MSPNGRKANNKKKREKIKGGLTAGRGRSIAIVSKETEANLEQRAEEEAAKQVGWSMFSYRRADLIEQKGTEEEKKLFDEGKKKVGVGLLLIYSMSVANQAYFFCYLQL
ncbi:MAG: hypothetical protein ACRD4B_01965 [Acidobacteriota bacterium]